MFNDYEVEGQMSIFDFVQNSTKNEDFSWDDDINSIYKMITTLASEYNIPVSKAEWSIWGHVPQFGYRMSITLDVEKSQLTDDLWQRLKSIIEYAESKRIEISPMTPVFLGSEKGWMHIFSTFLDRERQKIKKRGN